MSHIYIEGNQGGDTLADKDRTLNILHDWNETPRFHLHLKWLISKYFVNSP